jgi:hypothetical protein
MQITFRFRVKDKHVARLKEPPVARGETFVAAGVPKTSQLTVSEPTHRTNREGLNATSSPVGTAASSA